ncbi:MAG: FKBP-type peptidyl-prolyl cis-trans isomerase [Desulfobacterales bacterium]
MKKAELGKQVKVHYTVKLESGEVVGTSKRSMPLDFRIGKGKVLKGLEHGIIGMEVGQSRTITIPPEEGYGRRNEALMVKVKKSDLPTQTDIAVGRTVQFMNESGAMVNLIITEVGDETVTLDANHPFAGKTLIYDVILVAVY